MTERGGPWLVGGQRGGPPPGLTARPGLRFPREGKFLSQACPAHPSPSALRSSGSSLRGARHRVQPGREGGGPQPALGVHPGWPLAPSVRGPQEALHPPPPARRAPPTCRGAVRVPSTSKRQSAGAGAAMSPSPRPQLTWSVRTGHSAPGFRVQPPRCGARREEEENPLPQGPGLASAVPSGLQIPECNAPHAGQASAPRDPKAGAIRRLLRTMVRTRKVETEGGDMLLGSGSGL